MLVTIDSLTEQLREHFRHTGKTLVVDGEIADGLTETFALRDIAAVSVDVLTKEYNRTTQTMERATLQQLCEQSRVA